ncbi:MAG: RNA-binding motif protein, X-linked 2, partial [Paramarteilia canceri]
KIKLINQINEKSLKNDEKKSWHDQYKDSSWIYVGSLNYELSEGDLITVFSQYFNVLNFCNFVLRYGEIVMINLIRDRVTGKSKGYAFLCYEDQRSTVLAVDNFNGIKLVGRIIRVDHVASYKVPDLKKLSDQQKDIMRHGTAPGSKYFKDPITDERKEKN